MKFKVLILILSLIFLVRFISADTGYGRVSINVVNEAPEIVGMSILEEKGDLYCDVSFVDELNEINLEYKWFRNGELIIGENKNVLSSDFYGYNDKITCEVLPNDYVQDGKMKNITKGVDFVPIGFVVLNFGGMNYFSVLALVLIILAVFSVYLVLRRYVIKKSLS